MNLGLDIFPGYKRRTRGGAVSAHNHAAFVDGCYRCDLGRDELQYSDDFNALEAVVDKAIKGGMWPEDVAIDVADAVLSWLGSREGQAVADRAAKVAP